MSEVYYIHTLNGRAAGFQDETSSLYYLNRYRNQMLIKSLRLLRKQQSQDALTRKKEGGYPVIYGYMPVKLPEQND